MNSFHYIILGFSNNVYKKVSFNIEPNDFEITLWHDNILEIIIFHKRFKLKSPLRPIIGKIFVLLKYENAIFQNEIYLETIHCSIFIIALPLISEKSFKTYSYIVWWPLWSFFDDCTWNPYVNDLEQKKNQYFQQRSLNFCVNCRSF